MGDIMFGHKAMIDRINEIHREMGYLTNHEYNDYDKRKAKIKEIQYRLRVFLEAEDKINDMIHDTLKKFDAEWGKYR